MQVVIKTMTSNPWYEPDSAKGTPKDPEAQTQECSYRFQLLNIYLDGEANASERQQVEEWLASDQQLRTTYRQLLQLRQGISNLPIQEESTQQTAFSESSRREREVEQVLNRLERRQRRTWVWGGTAIAALFVGVVSGLSLIPRSQTPQLVQSPTLKPSTNVRESVTLALKRPVVEIPNMSVDPHGFETPQRATTGDR
jgi:anti-sigma factor RsiW